MNETASILYTTVIAGVAMGIIFFLLNKSGLLKVDGAVMSWNKFISGLHKENPTY